MIAYSKFQVENKISNTTHRDLNLGCKNWTCERKEAEQKTEMWLWKYICLTYNTDFFQLNHQVIALLFLVSSHCVAIKQLVLYAGFIEGQHYDSTLIDGDFLAANVPTLIDIAFSTLFSLVEPFLVDMAWCDIKSPPSIVFCFLLKQKETWRAVITNRLNQGITSMS